MLAAAARTPYLRDGDPAPIYSLCPALFDSFWNIVSIRDIPFDANLLTLVCWARYLCASCGDFSVDAVWLTDCRGGSGDEQPMPLTSSTCDIRDLPTGAGSEIEGRESLAPYEFIESVLRGISLVLFQSNAWTGLLIVGSLLLSSWPFGLGCLLGATVSTLTGIALKVDRDTVRHGLFGFNGALTGIALLVLTNVGAGSSSTAPGLQLWLYIGLASAFSTVLFRGFASPTRRAPFRGLTLPFCITTWIFFAALQQVSVLNSGALLHPSLAAPSNVSQAYGWDTLLYGTINGIAQVFFQQGWVPGVLIVAAIAINSRLSALMALLGSFVAAAAGIGMGVPEAAVRGGVYGYNPALTAIVLGGFLLLLNRAGFLYAMAGAVVTAITGIAAAGILEALGLPVLMLPFLFITWPMLEASKGFPALLAIPEGETATPERNLLLYGSHTALPRNTAA
jgi:urea transporter